MVHDQVGHDVSAVCQCPHVVPGTQPGIDKVMIDRIKPGVRAVGWPKDRQEVSAPEKAVERTVQQLLKMAKAAAGKTIHVGNQLDLIFHTS